MKVLLNLPSKETHSHHYWHLTKPQSSILVSNGKVNVGDSTMNLGEGTDAVEYDNQLYYEEQLLKGIEEKQRNGEELTAEEKKELERAIAGTTPGTVYNAFQNAG